MAGWGTGSFENEDAQKWLSQLSSLGIDDLKKIITGACQSKYLEAPEASIVVAAAEALAALKGAPGDKLPREIADWAGKVVYDSGSELNQLATQAVQKVRRSSELKDLWLQAEGLNEWSASLRDLEGRLEGDATNLPPPLC